MYKYDQPSDVCMNTKKTERRTDNIESEEKVYNTVGWTLSTFISEYDIPWYCFVIDPSNAELIPHVNITGRTFCAFYLRKKESVFKRSFYKVIIQSFLIDHFIFAENSQLYFWPVNF